MGVDIELIKNCSEQDQKDLSSIVDDGLRRNLVPDYYTAHFDPLGVYFASDSGERHGAVVAIKTEFGPVYLDKFVVKKDKHKNGFGRHLAEAVKKDHEKGFLRVRKDNPANAFYEKVFGKENRAETNKWYIYHWGLEEKEILKSVDFAEKRPETLEPPNDSIYN